MNEKGIYTEHVEPDTNACRTGEEEIRTEEPEEPVPTAIVRVKPEQDALVKAFYDQAVGLLDYAEKAVVETEEDYLLRVNDLTVIRTLRKALEEKRKEYTGPINEHLGDINAAFKTFTAPLAQADSITTKTMLDYRQKQTLIRQEQERINQLRIDAANAEMELKGELSESVDLVEVAPVAQKTTHSDLGSAGMTDCWKWEVIDFSLVPDEYKMINHAVLTPAAKSFKDTRTIPGIRIYNEPGIAVRR